MAKSLPKKDLVSFKELLLANSIQVDALVHQPKNKGALLVELFILRRQR